MPPAMPFDQLQELVALRDALRAAPPKGGERTRLIKAFAAARHQSTSTVYRWLKDHAGFETGRKRRADSGTSRLPVQSLEFIAGSIQQSVRRNGISTQPICVAMNIAHENGLVINVSESRIGALLRSQKMDVKTQATARNHQRLRSEHPNHVHQIDPSLCLVYYLGGRQQIMTEEQFNKNKPTSLEKVKLKVWRYVRYDHASRCVDARYFEAAGENQRSLFEFLLHTWGKDAQRLSHGVPRKLLWDKGSEFTSPGIRRLLEALGVDYEAHATHHAWVKGGVENANRLVEMHFESRLRGEPVQTVEQLNASAAAWVRDYNANAITHVDSRAQCDDGQLRVRDDLWNLIAHYPGALVEMPDRETCAYFMRGKEETRVITDSRITFVHPQTKKSELYVLEPWSHLFSNKQKVVVSPLLLGDGMVRVTLERYGQDAEHIDVAPEREFDAFGRPMSATLIGSERRTAPHTAAQEAAKRIAAATYGPGTSLDEAEKLKAKNARPFMHMNDGKGVVAHTHLGKGELPTRLLPEMLTIKTAELLALRTQHADAMLTHFQAAQELVKGGVAMSPELVATLKHLHPEAVPESALDDLVARLTVRAGLRVVGGSK
jgi:transposase InsO family protein